MEVGSECTSVSSFQMCIVIRFHLHVEAYRAPENWARFRSSPLGTAVPLVSVGTFNDPSFSFKPLSMADYLQPTLKQVGLYHDVQDRAMSVEDLFHFS